MKWAKYQPKDGDLILVCRHADTAERLHWYYIPNLKFRRPDGSEGDTPWVCLCGECSQLADHSSASFAKLIRGERRWTGNDPVIPDNIVDRWGTMGN
jgi:hypothetical protein